jgi:hypothetical protein
MIHNDLFKIAQNGLSFEKMRFFNFGMVVALRKTQVTKTIQIYLREG